MSAWTRIKDQEPAEFPVFVSKVGGLAGGPFATAVDADDFLWWRSVYGATHWMPEPGPPRCDVNNQCGDVNAREG